MIYPRPVVSSGGFGGGSADIRWRVRWRYCLTLDKTGGGSADIRGGCGGAGWARAGCGVLHLMDIHSGGFGGGLVSS